MQYAFGLTEFAILIISLLGVAILVDAIENWHGKNYGRASLSGFAAGFALFALTILLPTSPVKAAAAFGCVFAFMFAGTMRKWAAVSTWTALIVFFVLMSQGSEAEAQSMAPPCLHKESGVIFAKGIRSEPKLNERHGSYDRFYYFVLDTENGKRCVRKRVPVRDFLALNVGDQY